MEWVQFCIFLISVLIVEYIAISRSMHYKQCRRKDQTIAELRIIILELLEHQVDLCDTESEIYAIKQTLNRLYDMPEEPKQEFTPPEG